MTDPFYETVDESMSTTDSTIAAKDTTASPEQVKQLLLNRHVCPYCGHQSNGGTEACPKCTMEDSPATRQATKARIGPWYVLQSRNPSAPGMRFSTLVSLLRKGYITPKSVLRGPTTHQLWRFAANVRGISREFGLCYSCGSGISRTAAYCPSCQRSQDPPAEPDALLEPRHNGHSKPQPTPVEQPVTTSIEPSVIEVPPSRTTAIEPVNGNAGSYARRLRELNRRQEHRDAAARQELPARRSTQVVFNGDDRTVSAMSLAAALQSERPDMLVPSRRRLKGLLAVAAMLIIGAGVLFYFRPDYRSKSIAFAQQTWSTIRSKASSFDLPNVTTSPRPQETPASLARRTSSPVPPPPAVERIEIESPTTLPTAIVEAAIAPATAESIKPTGVAIAPTPAVAEPDPEVIFNQARALWVQANNAEADQDFASAVRFYEQIRQLPRDAWPGGLQIQLENVRKRMTSSSAN